MNAQLTTPVPTLPAPTVLPPVREMARPAAARPIPPVVRTPHSAGPAPAPVAPVVPVHWLVPVVVVVVGMFLSVLDSSIL
ncbi:MAG TPA: hypothetical protein VGH89_06595, partial [Pseudonocardia sp.]